MLNVITVVKHLKKLLLKLNETQKRGEKIIVPESVLAMQLQKDNLAKNADRQPEKI